MAAPVPESTSTATGASVTSLACNKPTGTADGDLLLAFVGTRNATGETHTTPADWTLVGSGADSGSGNVRLSLYRRAAGSSEPASYTFEFSGSTEAMIAISRVSGHDTSAPVNQYAFGSSASAAGDPYTCPAVTTTVDECLVYRVAVANHGSNRTRTAPSGTTERWNINSGSTNTSGWSGGATEEQTSAGSTGTADWTTSTDSGALDATLTVAIAPAAGGPATVEGAITAAATADDSFATLLTALASLAAAVEAGESWATTLLAQAAVSEDATASDAYAALATLLATLESAAAADDTMAAVATLQAELTAAVQAASAFDGGLRLEAAISEGVTAADTWAADVVTSVLAAFAADTEAGSTWAASVAALADWSEPAAAGDALAALLLGTATISEGVATGSTFAAMATLGATWDEAAEFGAAFSATIPGQTGAYLRVGVDLTPRLIAGIEIVPRLRAGVEVNPNNG